MKKSILLTGILLLALGIANQPFAQDYLDSSYQYGDSYYNQDNAMDGFDANALKYRRPVYPPQNYPNPNPNPSPDNYPYNYPTYPSPYPVPYNQPYYGDCSYDYYGQSNYCYPEISEFYKNVSRLWNGSVITITTKNQNIVNNIQSSIYGSVSTVFKNQPAKISVTDLRNGVKVRIVAMPSEDGTYRMWDNSYGRYVSVNAITLINTIQHFADNAMPVIDADGNVYSWQ